MAPHSGGGGGGVLKLDGVCAAQGLKTLPVPKAWDLRIFFSLKKWLNRQFCQNFCKLRTISKGFSASKMADFTIFVKWDLRIFLNKMGPMSKDFWWKVTHLGGTSPYALTCEYPTPRFVLSWISVVSDRAQRVKEANMYIKTEWWGRRVPV